MSKTRLKNNITSIIVTIIAIIIGIIIIFPIIYTFTTAFKPRSEILAFPPTIFPESFLYFDNFKSALELAPLFRFMLNSIIVALMGSTLRTLFAVFAAYSFAYFDYKFKNFIFYMILGTMMLPADTLLVTNFLTVSQLGLIDTYLGMCITSLVGAMQMFMLRQNFKTLPRALRDAAFIDGCSDLKYIRRIILPLSKPVIMTLLVQSFVSLWNSYLWPLLVTNQEDMRTVQVGITMLTTPEDTNYSLVLAAVSIVLIPSFILFAILRKNIVKGITAGSLVG